MSDGSTEIVRVYNEYKRLIERINSRYAHCLSKDEMYSCNLIAIHKTIKTHDNDKAFFHRYLQRKLGWELGSYVREEIRQRQNIIYTDCNITRIASNDVVLGDFFIDFNEKTDNMLYDRFVGNMTYEEMGKVRGISRETARKKYKQYIAELDINSV